MLKQLTLIILLFFIVLQGSAQQINTYRLWNEFEANPTDTGSFVIAVELHKYYQTIDFDSNIMAAKRILTWGEKKKFKSVEAYGYLCISNTFSRMGDAKQQQEYVLKATRINELYYNKDIDSRILNSKALIETDIEKKLDYSRKAIMLRDDKSIALGGYNLLLNPVYTFISIKRYDSALHYIQKADEIAIKYNDTALFAIESVKGLLYLSMKQFDIALVYLKRGMKIAESTNKTVNLLDAYNNMRSFADATNQQDQALLYARKAYHYSINDIYKRTKIAEWLYTYFQKYRNNDSAIFYMQTYIELYKNINNKNNLIQLQKSKFEEDLRQHNLEIERTTEREERNHNIQLALTAIAILMAIIVFLFLSRSIIVNHKIIEFLGVIVLLVVFEFINLLIHPFLEKITHHSPVLMLLGLVAIASLIIPLHHRLEHWTTKKLVEKNKAIRLANAKKTIEEIESSTN